MLQALTGELNGARLGIVAIPRLRTGPRPQGMGSRLGQMTRRVEVWTSWEGGRWSGGRNSAGGALVCYGAPSPQVHAPVATRSGDVCPHPRFPHGDESARHRGGSANGRCRSAVRAVAHFTQGRIVVVTPRRARVQPRLAGISAVSHLCVLPDSPEGSARHVKISAYLCLALGTSLGRRDRISRVGVH